MAFRVLVVLATFVVIAPLSCDRAGSPPEERTQDDGVVTPEGASASTKAQRLEPRGHITVESALLSSAGDTELIHARVSYGGSSVWPDCFLVDGPTMGAIRRYEEGGKPPEGRIVSRWPEPDSGEKSLQEDGTLLWVFREDTDSGAPDPRRTPYFVLCSAGSGPGIDDEAHVEGTPALDS